MARAGGRRLPGRCRRGGAARSLITWSGRTRVATSASLPEAWFFAVLILAGLSVGSLGLSLLGRLLGRNWVTPMDDELRPAALLIPLVARSEERRVGKECVCTFCSRWSLSTSKQTSHILLRTI